MIPPIAALIAWPVISAVLMARLRIPVAVLIVILAGYLLLPERFAIDLPMLPPIDKHTVPVLSILILGLIFLHRMQQTRSLPGLVPRSWLVRGLLAIIFLGNFGTVHTNPDPIIQLLDTQPALRPYDGFSMTLNALMMVLPLMIGRKYFHSQDTHRLLLVGICIAACIYALPALYEVRMSPQLNRMIYGFFPHEWRQHIRGDGFRPLVFLQHGLDLAIFLCIAILAAAGLVRSDGSYHLGVLAVLWLTFTLVLAKSLGALMIVVLLLPLVLFMPTRLQLMAAAVIGIVVLAYPILRGAQMVPIDRVMGFAESISAERAASFNTRLENEEELLARAMERPVFGWGGYGRPQVRNEKGINISIVDGYWIIILGIGGWVRYLGEFGLMTLPPLLLFLARRRYGIGPESGVLAIMLAATLIDAIPNSNISPITWLIVGALWGRLELGRKSEAAPADPQTAPAGRPRPVYARDFGHKRSRGRQAREGKNPPANPVQARPDRYAGN